MLNVCSRVVTPVMARHADPTMGADVFLKNEMSYEIQSSPRVELAASLGTPSVAIWKTPRLDKRWFGVALQVHELEWSLFGVTFNTM